MIHKDQKNNYAHSPAHDPPKENWKNLNFPPKTFQNPNYHYHQCIKKIKKIKQTKKLIYIFHLPITLPIGPIPSMSVHGLSSVLGSST